MTLFGEGGTSSRRVLAFIFAIAGLAAGIFAIVMKAEWQVVLIAFGVPILACVLLLLFTTWTDVAKVAEAVKGKN